MKVHRSLFSLLLTFVLVLLAACGQAATTQQAAQPTAATSAEGATEATAAPAAEGATEATTAPAEGATEATAAASEAPSPVPSPTPIPLSTVGSGATKIVWWHISTVEDQRANWENLANQFVQ